MNSELEKYVKIWVLVISSEYSIDVHLCKGIDEALERLAKSIYDTYPDHLAHLDPIADRDEICEWIDESGCGDDWKWDIQVKEFDISD